MVIINYDQYNPKLELVKMFSTNLLVKVLLDHFEFTLELLTFLHRNLAVLSSTLTYGDGVVVTRLEGKGNALNSIDISSESEVAILESNSGRINELVYASHGSPVNIRVVDPLKVPNAEFELIVNESDSDLEDADEVYWTLINRTMLDETNDSLKYIRTSTKAINVLNEELLLDWGLSITLHQHQYTNGGNFTVPVDATIEFDDPSAPWLLGVPDAEGFDRT